MREKQNDKRQSDQRSTKQIRIDGGLHYEAKMEAHKRSMTLRDLMEEGLAIVLGEGYNING